MVTRRLTRYWELNAGGGPGGGYRTDGELACVVPSGFGHTLVQKR
jgi:hypothetical protein